MDLAIAAIREGSELTLVRPGLGYFTPSGPFLTPCLPAGDLKKPCAPRALAVGAGSGERWQR